MTLKFSKLLVIALLFGSSSLSKADPAFAPIFGSHMVLQQLMPIPVFGTANAGEKVTVSFAGKTASAVTTPDGMWKLKLEALPASNKPEVMTVTSDNGKTVQLDDVLVGEVWVGSGQSNMEIGAATFLGGHPVGGDNSGRTAGDPNLQALVAAAPYPEVRLVNTHLAKGAKEILDWQPATPDNLKKFSAHLQCFGVQLQQKLNVPVGLILSAVGGTPSGRWISASAFAQDAACQKEVAKAKETFSLEKEQARYQNAQAKYEKDLAAWNALPADQKQGKRGPGKPFPMAGPGEGTMGNAIGDLHDQVLSPDIGYGIRGVLWDQGESGVQIYGVDQYTLMGALIKSWRQEWGQGDFPFIYVQKPSGGGCAFDYTDKVFAWVSDAFAPLPAAVPGGGENREIDIKISSYPNTFMSISSDLGGELHPYNKYGYAARDLRVALGAVYGQKLEIYGPTYANIVVKDNKVIVTFDHVGQGLVFKNGTKLQGFALAGADKKFQWADATIEGSTVVLSSASIPNPVYVRYAWAQQHPWANLFNQDGLPALAFRTDTAQ